MLAGSLSSLIILGYFTYRLIKRIIFFAEMAVVQVFCIAAEAEYISE